MEGDQDKQVKDKLSNMKIAPFKTVLVIHNQINLLHKSSKKHPECPERVIAIIQYLCNLAQKDENAKFQVLEYKKLVKSGQKKQQTFKVQVQKLIIQTHGQNYFQFVKEMFDPMFTNKKEMFINLDTYYMKDTYCSAFAAAQTLVRAVDITLDSDFDSNIKGNLSNPKYTVCIVRPPGHHSGMKSQPHGFSFFNNVAVGVNQALKKLKNKKIAIIDWDVHHGQGTQKLFYDSNQVLFISIHRFDHGKFFPHVDQSSAKFIGQGKGKGFNINVCWNIGYKNSQKKQQQQPNFDKSVKRKPNYYQGETVGDLQYIECFKKLILPILKQFGPQAIFVSCGFDSAQGDPIGDLKISQLGYSWMTNQLMKLSTKIIFVLQGGYDLDCLKWGSKAVINTLSAGLNSKQKMEVEMNQKIQQLKQKMRNNIVGNRNGKQYQCNYIGVEGINETLSNIKTQWKIDS